MTCIVEGVVDDKAPGIRASSEVFLRDPGRVAHVSEDEVDLPARAAPDHSVRDRAKNICLAVRYPEIVANYLPDQRAEPPVVVLPAGTPHHRFVVDVRELHPNDRVSGALA